MVHIEKSPPAATGGARELSCVAADVSENTQSQSSSQAFLIGLADKVEDARRRIEERVLLVIDDDDALLLEETADFLMWLDEALRRAGGAAR
jgi:hypothetical protein